MRYLGQDLTGAARAETYRSARHATLNFESCGGERSSSDDASLRPLGQMIYFPAKAAARVVVTTNRKEENMTDEKETAGQSKESRANWRIGGDHERNESFSPTGPVRARITTKSGDVRVRTGEGDELKVTLRVGSAKHEENLEIAEVRFDTASNELEIRSQPDGFSLSMRGVRGGAKRSWGDFGGSDPDVFVELPRGSSLEVKTISGDVATEGSLDDVKVSSISGDVSAPGSSNNLDVKTASGDVKAGSVRDTLRCRSASGDVVCKGAATKTEITSASGDVELSADRPGEIVVKAVSGDVRVRVARGLAVDVNGNTVSGDLGTNIDLDATGDASSDEEVISIKVHTVSGDIRIDKAS
jgi:hypothetical protein